MSEEPEKPLTGEDAERQPTKPDPASPSYARGADVAGPPKDRVPGDG